MKTLRAFQSKCNKISSEAQGEGSMRGVRVNEFQWLQPVEDLFLIRPQLQGEVIVAL